MAVRYQQKCSRCRTKYVLMGWGQKYPVCYDCSKPELNQKITDPKMKKMFNIPEEFYKKSAFMRSIKMNYLRYGNLTEKQLEAFKKAVKDMKAEARKK